MEHARELPTVDREIDGVRFRITKLPFKHSRSTLLLLSNRVFPALKTALAGADLSQASGDRGRMLAALLPRIASALADIVGGLSEADLARLEEVFGEYSSYANGTDALGHERWAPMVQANREALFGGGRMMLYTRWIAACVEVSFGDFFDALRGKLTVPSS